MITDLIIEGARDLFWIGLFVVSFGLIAALATGAI